MRPEPATPAVSLVGTYLLLALTTALAAPSNGTSWHDEELRLDRSRRLGRVDLGLQLHI